MAGDVLDDRRDCVQSHIVCVDQNGEGGKFMLHACDLWIDGNDATLVRAIRDRTYRSFFCANVFSISTASPGAPVRALAVKPRSKNWA